MKYLKELVKDVCIRVCMYAARIEYIKKPRRDVYFNYVSVRDKGFVLLTPTYRLFG